MKIKIITFAVVLLSLCFTSCDYDSVKADGEITSRTINYSDYSALKVSDAFTVYLSFSERVEEIVVKANDNLHDKIYVQKNGNTLEVRLDDNTSIRGNATLHVYITTASINDFDISGASEIILDAPLDASRATINLKGASEFSGEMYVTNLNLKASGASELDIFGVAEQLNATLTGASDLKNYDLVIEDLDLQMSGASEASLSVTNTLKIDASGASRLRYKGDADVTDKKLSGASELVRK